MTLFLCSKLNGQELFADYMRYITRSDSDEIRRFAEWLDEGADEIVSTFEILGSKN